jgi:putative hydrolase of the HAD superfamily
MLKHDRGLAPVQANAQFRAMTIRAVIFDLDGTLLDRQATFELHLAEQAKRLVGFLPSDLTPDYVQRMLVLDQNGYAPRDQFYRDAEAELHLPVGAASVLLADFRQHFPEQCIPFAGMHETLQVLRDRGIVLGLITNGTVEMQGRKIERLGIAPLFDVIIISEAEGVRKPDPRIFRSALERLQVPASSAVYVGDNPEADIRGARNCGLGAIWKRDGFWPAPPEPDWVIDDLAEIPHLLERVV